MQFKTPEIMAETKSYWKAMLIKSVDRFKEGKEDAISILVNIIYQAEKEKETVNNLIKQYSTDDKH